MVPNLRRARAGALLILLWASGCSLFSGVYLHDDAYQQKADSAQAEFNKINLTSKFNDQFTKVTIYDNDEDKAVAQLQVASRNQQLQDFIELPGWYDTSDCGTAHICSGPAALRDYSRHRLQALAGYQELTNHQVQAVRNALYREPEDKAALQVAETALSNNLQWYRGSGGKDRSAPCNLEHPEIASPAQPPQDQPFNPQGYFWKEAQFYCIQLALLTRDDSLNELRHQIQSESILAQVIDQRADALKQRAGDQEEYDNLSQQIKEITESTSTTGAYTDKLRGAVTKLQSALKVAHAVAKYLGYKALADQLQSFLSAQISQNSEQTQQSLDHPVQSMLSSQTPQNSAKSKNSKTQTGSATTSKTSQAQALIDVAMDSANLNDTYAGQGSFDRTNSLLLATAAARHQMDMAKLNADYQADLITIYIAEIDSLLREVMHLYEADRALGPGPLSGQGFATIPFGPPGADARKHIDALAAWSASQDEGEIPYQVLAAKEVQLLRAQSVKQGQLSAQGYENVIKPVLAELDAYGKGGITTQTIVQALGFVGVITATAVK